jgi:hypothetical protein
MRVCPGCLLEVHLAQPHITLLQSGDSLVSRLTQLADRQDFHSLDCLRRWVEKK